MNLDKSSEAKLVGVHSGLVRLVREVHERWPKAYPKETGIRVTCGYRGEKDQNDAVKRGVSKTPWPKSKHNRKPAMAVDLLPLPFVQKDWNDLARWDRFGRFVLKIAHELSLDIRWGADWDRDGKLREKGENDSPHFELVG